MSRRHWWELTIRQADEVMYFGVECPKCKETRMVDLQRLGEQLGQDTLMDTLRGRFKCSGCGTRKGVITSQAYKGSSWTERQIANWKR